jgi:hypothetical protein
MGDMPFGNSQKSMICIRIRKFLGLPDPNPLLFVWIRIWIRILPLLSKKRKKNLDF